MLGKKHKTCPHCGAKIDQNSTFCNICGEEVKMDSADIVQPNTGKKSNVLQIIIIILVVIALGGCSFVLMQTMSLKQQLMRGWSRAMEDDGVYYTVSLEFNEDTVDYNFSSSLINDTIYTFEYKVVGNRLLTRFDENSDWRSHEVEFDDDKTMMIVYPAITSADSTEDWFNFD